MFSSNQPNLKQCFRKAKSGNHLYFEILLASASPHVINSLKEVKDNDGNNLLMLAAANNDCNHLCVDTLLKIGISVEDINNKNETALIIAIKKAVRIANKYYFSLSYSQQHKAVSKAKKMLLSFGWFNYDAC